MVGRRERGQAHLVVARLGKPAQNGGGHVVGGALADRAVHHARLAEAAAARAAAQDLDVETIVHHLGERHDARLPAAAFGETAVQALLDKRRQPLLNRFDPRTRLLGGRLVAPAVQRRNVPTILVRERAQDVGARGAGLPHAADERERLRHGLLALADRDRIEERRVRFGVVGAGASAEHEQRTLGALVGMQRNARQIERLKDVGRRELVGQRDADRIELRHRRAALDAEQRKPLAPHGVAERRRGEERPLGTQVGRGVDGVHEDAQRLVCLTELVGVGVDHAEGEIGILLAHAAELVVEVARRPLGLREQRLEPRPQIGHLPHARTSPV